MDKKKIIIIVVVVALLYLLYKNGSLDSLLKKDTGSDSDGSSGTSNTSNSSGINLNDTNSIINATSMSETKRKACKSMVRHIESRIAKGEWSKANVNEQADDNGVTYEQQMVLNSIYQMWATASSLTQKQYETYREEILDL